MQDKKHEAVESAGDRLERQTVAAFKKSKWANPPTPHPGGAMVILLPGPNAVASFKKAMGIKV